MDCLAIIPARGGSVRIKKKNIRDFLGRPIITYSIEAALESGLFSRILVSTDDWEIRKVVRTYFSDAPEVQSMERDPGMSGPDVTTLATMSHVLGSDFVIGAVSCRSWWGLPEYTACIYPCAPLMTSDDLRRGFELMVSRSAQYALPVDTERQCIRDAGAWYWGHTAAWLNQLPIIGPWTVPVPIPKERVCDINVEQDWLEAERLYGEAFG